MRRFALALLILAALLAGLVATQRNTAPRADFTYLEVQDIHTLDPQRMSYQQDMRLAYALFEGLVRWDTQSEDFHVVPALAKSWETSQDRTTYTFHLRAEARWSNNDPVRASDFLYAWRRAMTPDTAADYSALFFRIKGAEEFFRWRTEQLAAYAARPDSEKSREAAATLSREADEQFRKLVALEAPDDHTLIVTLVRPTAYFLDLCAFASFLPVHPANVERFVTADPRTGARRQDSGWTRPDHLITNGPYILRDWKFKRELLLERSTTYTGPATPRSNLIRMLPIGEPNTAVLAYATGSADWISDVNVDYIPELIEQTKRGERTDFHAFNSFGTYFWNFNCAERFPDGSPNPLHDPRVRRAFALAIKKSDLTDLVRRRGESPRDTLIPPGSIAGYHSPKGLPYDPARAKRELADAGWTLHDGAAPTDSSGREFPVVTMLVPGTPAHHVDTALTLGRMWEETLGVRTRVEVKDTKSIKADLTRRSYMTSRAIWFGDYGDPVSFLDINRSTDGNNDRAFNSPRYDSLLDQAEREPDPAARLKLLEEAERILVEEEVPLIPLYAMMEFQFFPKNVTGLSSHPRRVQYLWQLGINRDSPESREPPAQAGGQAPPPSTNDNAALLLPLPLGEGRGEGFTLLGLSSTPTIPLFFFPERIP
ncbi:MAG TPA: peptide ABC transporter substrate-binding protein [Phycisphaerales bacterium]|nr:peptide ABC transporter substrate-binding protein [Phycisphaerales bacterium]